VGLHAETLRPPVDHRPRRAPATPRPRRPDATAAGWDAPATRPPDEQATAGREPPAQADRGLMLLIIFTASALLVVALVVLAGAVGQMWILAPIMIVDFAVTAAVLVTVAKLLEDAAR
jgi:hypothetical protein